MNAMTRPWQLPDALEPAYAVVEQPSLFQGLTARERSKVNRAFTEELYGDGDPVRRNGDGGIHLGIVLRGGVREDVPDRDGTSRLFDLTFKGETLMPIGPRVSGNRFTAMGETVLLHCEADALMALMNEVPKLRLNYIQAIQDRLSQTRDWQMVLGRKTAPERMATLLYSFWERQGYRAELDLHLNRLELGQLLGLTFETVSRQIKALEQAGAIALPQPSRVHILAPQLLHDAKGDGGMSLRAA